MTSNPFYVYIIKCKNGNYYTGYTDNLELRLKEHKGEIIGGAKYTLSHGVDELVYSEPFYTQEAAEAREKEIKKMDHNEKEITIQNNIYNNI